MAAIASWLLLLAQCSKQTSFQVPVRFIPILTLWQEVTGYAPKPSKAAGLGVQEFLLERNMCGYTCMYLCTDAYSSVCECVKHA
jgi:hypothetical protein